MNKVPAILFTCIALTILTFTLTIVNLQSKLDKANKQKFFQELENEDLTYQLNQCKILYIGGQ